MSNNYIVDKDFIKSHKWINLRDLFTLYFDINLPNWIDKSNVIYYIRNLVNGKGYVGQSTNFKLRFIGKSRSHLVSLSDGINTYLYNAIRKYKSRNFEVCLLEFNLNGHDELNSHENFWISKLHTYFLDNIGWGYNMTSGGDANSTKSMKEIREISKLKDDGGITYYGAAPVGFIMQGTANHVVNSIIETIKKRISELKEQNLEITPYNYFWNTYAGKHMYDQHIPRILNWIDDLRKSNNWTLEFEELFSHFKINLNPEAKGRNRIILE